MSQQQQLSLHGFIPDAEVKISLHTLHAICGMPPQRIFEHCIVWVPKNPFKPVMGAGQVNQIEQYRITSSADISKEETEPKVVGFHENPDVLQKRRWTLQIHEIPEAGKRKVTSQSILTSTIVDGDEPFNFMDKLGYKYSYEYWQRGYRFILGDIVLTLFRICIQDTSSTDEIKPLKLLDPSGRWTMKAHINVRQLTDMEGINNATSQLEKLQTDLTGVVDLVMPDRNCLNTRIK
ncbi:hypothetical protein TRICI_000503 [Trichomonascus ciferrii]|uniref:Mediator of RNA polymerase II transcription subunit 18 n=1 Tax=Trichomonascus ciferrii TaxID=44093 RepID=A0A642VD89_9ASCO|nr:hypothetical protein TRICI_000503 [Trichomonascus ciferrii]